MAESVTKTPSISSKSLIGVVVTNTLGEELGETEELLVSLGNGCVSSLILSTLGPVEKKRLAIPWDMLKIDPDTAALSLDIDRDFLQRLPTYQGEE